MKKLIFFVFLFCLGGYSERTTAQITSVNSSLYEKFDTGNFSSLNTVSDLSSGLRPLAANKKEILQLLYFWTYKYMSVDSTRFYKGAAPLSVEQSLMKRAGMCEEFTNLLYEYCKLNQIPCLKVEGYVRPVDFRVGHKFEEGNHMWNAVFIENQWLLCDLLWSESTLKLGANVHFVKEAKPEYFLAEPATFLPTHLPLSPVFQFNDNPVSIEAFTSVERGIDDSFPRGISTNYRDSLRVLLSMNEQDRSLKLAKQAFNYNRNNPNVLIATAYNYAINIVNRKTAATLDLKRAKAVLSLAINYIPLSKKPDILSLKEPSIQALNYVNRRIAFQK